MSIQRIVLNINGVDREILCEPEKDSLADVVRRLGLTGTKVGCGTGPVSYTHLSGTLMTKTSSPLMREISLSEILGMPSMARRK